MNREHISQAEIVGRLGQKPELEHTAEGTAFARLPSQRPSATPTAVGRFERRPNGTAQSRGVPSPSRSPAFNKGDSVALAGSMRINSYEKDGAKNRTIELHVDKAEPERRQQLSEERGAARRCRARGREVQGPRQRDRHDHPQHRHHHDGERQVARGLAQRHLVGEGRRGRTRHQSGRVHLGQRLRSSPQLSWPRRPGDEALRDRRPAIPGPRALGRPRSASAGPGQGSGSRAVAPPAGRAPTGSRPSARQGCRTRHVTEAPGAAQPRPAFIPPLHDTETTVPRQTTNHIVLPAGRPVRSPRDG